LRRDTRPGRGRRGRELYVLTLLVGLTRGCTEGFQGLEPFQDDPDASASSGTGAWATSEDASSSNGGAASTSGSSGSNPVGASGETGSTVDASGTGGEDAGSDADATAGGEDAGSDGDATAGDAGSRGDATDAGAETGAGPPLTTPLQTITGHAGDRLSSFGRSIAISNDWALIGAIEDSPAGIVYVARRDVARRWSIGQKLTVPAAPGLEPAFGFSVAMDGDAAIVGAPRFATEGSEVHFFARSTDDVWRPAQPPSTSPSPRSSDAFGYAVALDGLAAAVGIPGGGNVPGAVFTYRYAQGSWLGPNELTLPQTPPSSRFASDIAIDGSTLVVCAQRAAYTFDWTGNAWVYEQRLEPEAPNEYFCGSLALQGDTLLVGQAFGGAIRVFTRVAGAWRAGETIETPPELVGRSRAFGSQVKLCGDVAIAGSPTDVVTQGSVTFLRNTATGFRPFGFSFELIPDLYDVILACSGRSITVVDSLAGSRSTGAAYFFDLLE
jgi:hypothetical protein